MAVEGCTARQRAPEGCHQEKESVPDGRDSVETDIEKFFLLFFCSFVHPDKDFGKNTWKLRK